MSLETDLRDLARDIAEEAGELARARRADGVTVAASKSTLADIVTEADRDVERLIRDRLSRERPGDGFLGEESGEGESETGITWVVDPIDGTVNYAYGSPHYAVSIAAVTGETDPRAWTALAGVVRVPGAGETYAAARGHGARLESAGGARDLAVTREVPAGALIATGFGYDPATHRGDIETVQQVMPIARDIRRAGAAAVDLAYVAAGRVDAFFERGLQPWDLAAGALLVEEAGGAMRWLAADRFGRRMLIAAHAPLADRIAERASGVTADE